jgi:hypothetical protein
MNISNIFNQSTANTHSQPLLDSDERWYRATSRRAARTWGGYNHGDWDDDGERLPARHGTGPPPRLGWFGPVADRPAPHTRWAEPDAAERYTVTELTGIRVDPCDDIVIESHSAAVPDPDGNIPEGFEEKYDDEPLTATTVVRVGRQRHQRRTSVWRPKAIPFGPERPPAGWTDLPWWKDGVFLNPDFSGIGRDADLDVGPGQPHPFNLAQTKPDDELRFHAECVPGSEADREFDELCEEFERRFGREPAKQHKVEPKATLHEEPIPTQIDNADNRNISVEWESYYVPDLERFGSMDGGVTDLGLIYNYFAATVEKDKMRVVTVPAGLVAKLGAFWAYKERDESCANFLISIDKLTNLLRRLTITAEQERVAKCYVPLIAYNKYMQEGDHIARLVQGRYINRRTWRAMLIGGGAALAAVPACAALSMVGATAAGVVLGGSAASALAAGAAWFSIKLRGRPQAYSRVITSMNSLARRPANTNPTARVESVDVPDRPQDAIRNSAGLIIGTASGTYLPTVFADNRDNQLAALEKRVLAAPPENNIGTIKDFLAFERRNRHKILGRAMRIDELPFDKWLANINSTVSVKKRLLQAKNSLRERGIDTSSTLDPESLHRATSRSSFCKFETLLKGTRLAENDGAPRLIQGAHPEMTVSVGPWMSAFQGRMRKQLDGRTGLMFTSGKTVREVGQFIGQKIDEGWTPFDDDIGAFDLSIITPYCNLENEWANHFHAPALTMQLLRANVKTHGFTSLGWKYKVDGTRKSGDCGTSVFNTLLNLVFHLYVFCKERACEVEEALNNLVMAAQGDDNVGAHTGKPIDWKRWMAELGFKSVPHYPNQTANVEFCSHYLTRDSLGWTFKPKVGRILAKFGVSLRATEKTALPYLRGNALSLQATAASCPPLRLLVDWALNKTRDIKEKYGADEPWKMRADREGEATTETWSDLEERYGYTHALHAQFEQELADAEPGEILERPVYDMLCGRDTDGVARDEASWFGLPIGDSEIGPCVVPDNLEYQVEIPGTGTVVVEVPGKDCSTYGHIAKKAFRKAGLGDGPKTSQFDILVAGKPEPTHNQALTTSFSIRMKGKGGGLTASSGTAVAAAAAAIVKVSPDVVARVAARIPAALANVMQELPREIVSDTVEAAVLATWDGWVKVEAHDPDEVKLAQAVAVVRVCGYTVVHPFDQGVTVAELVTSSHRIPQVALDKLQAFSQGRPVAWSDVATGDIEVRAKGLGGASISSSERKVSKLIAESGCLPTSMGYLWAVLDGFHDHEFTMEGVPDQMIAGSVRQCVRQTATIAVPGGITGNWDCNIVSFPDSLPYLSPQYQQDVNTVGGITSGLNSYQGGTQNYLAGGIIGYASASGAAQNMGSATPMVMASVQASKSSSSQRYIANVPGSWREYARSIEVINSTAPLYQQGQCIVWRQPMPSITEATTSFMMDPSQTTGSLPGAFSAVRAPSPPASSAEAIQLMGSREWHAKEGCYFMNTSNGDDNPLINGQYMYTLWYDDNFNDVSVHGPQWDIRGPTGYSVPAYRPTAYQPFNMSGAYFVGLSNQTTLTVSVRSYVEIFPSQIGNTLTSLASPSAPYDERARRLYAECMKTMPPGVMLCENGFGDWLSDVAGKIANFVSPVANVVGRIAGSIPHPLAQAVARGANMVEGVSSQFIAPSSTDVRDDGVASAIAREKRMLKSEAKVRNNKNVAVAAKQAVAARNAKVLAKLQAQSAARVAAIKKRK